MAGEKGVAAEGRSAAADVERWAVETSTKGIAAPPDFLNRIAKTLIRLVDAVESACDAAEAAREETEHAWRYINVRRENGDLK